MARSRMDKPLIGHQNAIERIAMMRRQRRCRECVHMRDGEPFETAQPHAFGYVERRRLGKRKLSDRVLDRDFPSARGRKISVRRRIGERLEGIVG